MSKGNSVVRNAIVLICLGFAVLVVAVPSVTTSWLWLIPTICVPFYASEIDERLFRFDNDVASIQVDLDAIRVDLDFIREDLDRLTARDNT